MLKNIYVLLALSLILTACGGNTPEKVAINFHQSLINQDFESAKKYCTKESAPMLDMMLGMVSMLDEDQQKDAQEKVKDANVVLVSSEVDKENKTATVTLKTTTKDEEKEQTIDLKEVDGEWKVVFSK